MTEVKKGAMLVAPARGQRAAGRVPGGGGGRRRQGGAPPVEPGDRVGTLWVIDSGLAPGDRVVIEGFSRVKAGAAVQPQEAPAEAAEAETSAAPVSPAQGGGDAMARFFIDRPIVAIVIAILTVLLGLVAMVGLPIAQYPDIVPPLIQIQGSFPGADAVDRRAVGGDAARAADERRREHALHAVDERQRRHDDPARHLRRRHRPQHRQGPRAEPVSRRPRRACRRT